MIIDSHQHFWKYSLQKYSWINDEMNVLKKDFLPDDLWEIYKDNDVKGCVAVQANQSAEETDFLLELADQHHFIKAVVGWVDLRDGALENALQSYRKHKKLKGFRHVVQDEPDPEFMLDEKFQRGLGLLGKHGFTYDLLVYPHQLKAAIQTVRKFPDLKFVLDHIAKPDIKNQQIDQWAELINTLASESNVCCKVSGMVTEASWKNWQQANFTPYLDVVFESFGIDRVMFGSDWPVCLLSGNYQQVLGIIKQYVAPFSAEDKQKLFHKNVVSFYGLETSD